MVTRVSAGHRTANLVGAVAITLTDRLNEVVREAGGTGTSAPPALATLLTYRGRTMSIERLRQVLGRSHSATVRLVDDLGEAGLVRREGAQDGREVSLVLTLAGERAAERILHARQELLDRLVTVFDGDERKRLTRLLEKLLASLTSSRRDARRTCRLCDHDACEENAFCPVDRAATLLGQ